MSRNTQRNLYKEQNGQRGSPKADKQLTQSPAEKPPGAENKEGYGAASPGNSATPTPIAKQNNDDSNKPCNSELAAAQTFRGQNRSFSTFSSVTGMIAGMQDTFLNTLPCSKALSMGNVKDLLMACAGKNCTSSALGKQKVAGLQANAGDHPLNAAYHAASGAQQAGDPGAGGQQAQCNQAGNQASQASSAGEDAIECMENAMDGMSESSG